jgi:hypothetical protein
MVKLMSTISNNPEYIQPSEREKGKISSFLEYKALKVKEYFGKINKSELSKLLNIDFKQELLDNPPLNDSFDPKIELEKVKSSPKVTRKQALEEYKSSLLRQQEALAICRTFMERMINVEPDVSKDELMFIFNKFKTQYGFSSEQENIFSLVIDSFLENRKNMKKLREKFKDDRDLVTHLTRIVLDTDAKVDVKLGPFSFDIDANDVAAAQIYTQGQSSDKNFWSNMSLGGFKTTEVIRFTEDSKPEKVYLTFNHAGVDELAPPFRSLFELFHEQILVHEREHVKNSMIEEIIENRTFDRSSIIYPENYASATPYQIELNLRNYLNLSLERVKDELLAQVKGGSKARSKIFFENGYYSKHGGYSNLKDPDFPDVWKDYIQKISIDEYESCVSKGVDSFNTLVNEGGFSKDEAIALLTDVPFKNWPKFCRRIIAAKKKTPAK